MQVLENVQQHAVQRRDRQNLQLQPLRLGICRRQVRPQGIAAGTLLDAAGLALVLAEPALLPSDGITALGESS
jgi:hypothetical protein